MNEKTMEEVLEDYSLLQADFANLVSAAVDVVEACREDSLEELADTIEILEEILGGE